MRLILIVALLATTFTRAGAVEAHFVGTSLTISDGKYRVVIPEQIDPYAFFKTIHATHRRGNVFYVLFGTSEMSRGWPPKNGYCGAGIESFIKWLKIQDGKIVEEKEGRYESCFQNRDGWSINWIDGKLVWISTGTREREVLGQRDYELVDFTWTFDPQNPEKGIEEHVERSKE